MKHLRKFNEQNISKDSKNRIPESTIDVVNILSDYCSPFEISVFDCFDKLNTMSEKDLEEFYESVSSNRRENNSNEENFMLDMIEKFKLI
jgi:hypothetical protein